MSAAQRHQRVAVLPDALVPQASRGTETSQGVMALVKPPEWKLEQLFGGCAAGGGARWLAGSRQRRRHRCARPKPSAPPARCFVKGTVSPYNPKTLRASAGSLFRVPFAARYGRRPGARGARSRTMWRFTPRCRPARRWFAGWPILPGRCALIIGNEARGVSRELRSAALRGLHSDGRRGVAQRRRGRRYSAV